jgi:CDP-diglyceride synthetase
MTPETLARTLTNVLNPFVIFTALYVLVAFAEGDTTEASLYVALELLAAAAVAGYVLLMRRRRRVGDFWISARAERLIPALFLLVAFVALLGALRLLDAPENLSLLTLSMGLASAAVALLTLFFKASAHCTVAGHAAASGLLLLGPQGWIFAIALPLVVWARVAPGEHTALEALTGAAVGAGFAALLLA